MKIDSAVLGQAPLEFDALIIPTYEDSDESKILAGLGESSVAETLSQLRQGGEWEGDQGEVQNIMCQFDKKSTRIVLVGLGARKNANNGILRQVILKGLRQLKNFKGESLGILVDGLTNEESTFLSLVEGVYLGAFNPKLYQSSDGGQFLPKILSLIGKESIEEETLKRIGPRAKILADSVNLARTLTNEPGNRLGPIAFAERAVEWATEAGLEIEVLEESKLKELQMNAVLAVASGSPEPARFLILKHWHDPDPERPPIALVGKGVTFDSGGISIKPSKGMEEMKMDKAGGCSVFAAMIAISRLELPQNVVGLVPLVENLPGNGAQRPGDVIRSMSGKTIEVLNTDAEGRLILADAITYAKQIFSARVIVDLATLTGACMVALGRIRAGLFSNDESALQKFLASADCSGEKFWQMPLDSEYRKELDSAIADIKNIGGRWAGAITAAKFLEEFVGDVPWCHVDMAGMDVFSQEESDLGPSGFGVLTLAEFVEKTGS